MKRVTVHVERLRLIGRDFGDRDALAAGLRHELGRLLAEPRALHALASLGHVASIRAGPFKAGVATTAGDTGAAIGRAIARSTRR